MTQVTQFFKDVLAAIGQPSNPSPVIDLSDTTFDEIKHSPLPKEFLITQNIIGSVAIICDDIDPYVEPFNKGEIIIKEQYVSGHSLDIADKTTRIEDLSNYGQAIATRIQKIGQEQKTGVFDMGLSALCILRDFLAVQTSALSEIISTGEDWVKVCSILEELDNEKLNDLYRIAWQTIARKHPKDILNLQTFILSARDQIVETHSPDEKSVLAWLALKSINNVLNTSCTAFSSHYRVIERMLWNCAEPDTTPQETHVPRIVITPI